MKRKFLLDLQHERWDPFFRFRAEAMPEVSVQDCVRELLANALASVVNDHGWIEGRREAVRVTTNDARRRIGEALGAISRDMIAQAETEANASGEVPMHSGVIG